MLKKSIYSVIRSNSKFFSFSVLLLTFWALNLQTGFAQTSDSSQLTLERIFSSSEFIPKRFGAFRWLKDGNSFAKLQPSPTIKGAMDLVSYEIKTNKRAVLISAEKLMPKGATAPLSLHGFEWSANDRQVLIYTNCSYFLDC